MTAQNHSYMDLKQLFHFWNRMKYLTQKKDNWIHKLKGRGFQIYCTNEITCCMYYCDIFGYHIWLQSDAAFYYPRLDKYSFSVGMFWVTCDLTRRPLGRLATASSLEGNVSRHGERGLVVSVLGKFLMDIINWWFSITQREFDIGLGRE